MTKVLKFGGSSLADAPHFVKVRSIIQRDDTPKIIVPSAPGKRNEHDEKVTDLLYAYFDRFSAGEPCGAVRAKIQQRYEEIAAGLGVKRDIGREFEQISSGLERGLGRDYLASRGEYLNGLLMAEFLGADFIDAAELIRFDERGRLLLEETVSRMRANLSGAGRVVVPGFYGGLPDGSVRTFQRGGSDITGALAACATGADAYENWTDVSGVLMADPNIVKAPLPVRVLTYEEMHRLSCFGAEVLHEAAIYPVKLAGIPIYIKNTNCPQDRGTTVVSRTDQAPDFDIISITGKKEVCAIRFITSGSGRQLEERVVSYLRSRSIVIYMSQSAKEEAAVWISGQQFHQNEHEVMTGVRKLIGSGCYVIDEKQSFIAVGCRKNADKFRIMSMIRGTLRRMSIRVRAEDPDGEEPTVLFAVDRAEYEHAIQGIYDRFTGSRRSGRKDRTQQNMNSRGA